ncbi:MAG: helix-turn-helix domain-containing protein [Methylobacterium organophilum]|nr:helix-turn-helix domain-containing protein [Methylobacterium organophilum]
MYPTPAQIRAARALLGISQEELAELARVSKRTIANMESGDGRPIRATKDAVFLALLDAGIEFTYDEVRDAHGVRLVPGA